MNLPQTQDYQEWGKNYIKLVEGDIFTLLNTQIETYPSYLHQLEDKADYAYAPGKWTIKEMTGHILDTERVLTYRLLCFARGEKAALPGFDENEYVANARFKDRSLASLAEEFVVLRKSNLYLINSLNEEELNRTGVANDTHISVKALISVLGGHIIHHCNVIEERYL